MHEEPHGAAVRPRPYSAEDRLDSWKEIAAYMKREVRSVQRWEASEGLPVHRRTTKKQPAVFAFKSEVDEWWKQNRRHGEKGARSKLTHIVGGLRRLALVAGLVTTVGLLVAFLSNELDSPGR